MRESEREGGGIAEHRKGVQISPECGVRFTGSRKDGDQRRVTTGAQLPCPRPQPPPTPVSGENRCLPAFLRGRCLGVRARDLGSGFAGFLLLIFIGPQNLRQKCQQLKLGQILVLGSLNTIK